jgi:hypothetical protein
MTGRERIIAAIQGQPVDKAPWIPECSWSYFAGLPEYQRFIADGRERVKPELQDEALAFRVQFYQERIKGEFMQWCANPGARRLHPGAKEETGEEGNKKWTRITTPKGEITEIYQWQTGSRTWFPIKEFIESLEDLAVFEYLMEEEIAEPCHEDLARELAIVGEGGVYFSSTAAAPLKSLAIGWMPLEFLATLMVEELPRMEKLFAKMHENNLALVKLQTKGPAKVFMDAAVTGLGMVSPRWIKNHYTPYSKEYHRLLGEAGKLTVFHTSGEPILAIADEIAASGVNLQYGIAVPPWGEAPLSEIRRAIGPKVALSGGLEPAFLSGATPETAKARATEVLQDMQGQPGLLLGTADDTPWETAPEVLAAVGETAEEFAAALPASA